MQYDRSSKSLKVIFGEWGTCERILRRSEDSEGRPADLDMDAPTGEIAYLADGSGYFASLTTRSDFGCTLFENVP
jgi:hypothetical protein